MRWPDPRPTTGKSHDILQISLHQSHEFDYGKSRYMRGVFFNAIYLWVKHLDTSAAK